MPTNDFLQIAKSGGANVAAQAAFLANTVTQNNGFASGVVDSPTFNKILRQSSFVSAMIGKFINDYAALDALDDGDLTTFEARFLSALQKSPGLTPAQFDNTTSYATTAFTKQRGLQYAGVTSIVNGQVLTAAACGGVSYAAAGSTTGVTLPLLSTVVTGAAITVKSLQTAITTLSRQGSDLITVNGADVTSVSFKFGEEVVFVANQNLTRWVAFGSGVLKSMGGFESSVSGSTGYHLLPDGTIEQWGSATVTAGTLLTVALPISYTTAGTIAAFVSPGSSNPTAFNYATAFAPDLSHVSIALNTGTQGVQWRTIGK